MAVGIEEQGSKFITTEAIKNQEGKQKVWDAVRSAFSDRNCIGYWRYPIFSKVGEIRKEPDILIVDREIGVIVIEIKSLKIEQFVNINGQQWQLQNSDTTEINPYQQAEHQLRALISYSDREPALWRKVNGKAIVALPEITSEQWQEKGYDKLPDLPPIIFQDQLGKVGLLEQIQKGNIVISGANLEDKDWELLLSVIGGTPVLRKPQRNQVTSSGKTRSSIIDSLREKLYEIDLQQEHIGKEIPAGPQRIRGIAGSGKTVLLCQKAASMHLKHPDWDIALVFFTRSLYDLMIGLIDQWIRRFSCGEMHYDPTTNFKLQVLHAWGAKEQPGLYRTICEYHGKRPGTVQNTNEKQPNRGLIDLSKRLLEEITIEPMFDAILIDEGQDLVTEDDLKYEDKQAIYWLAYQSLRPVSEDKPQERRLIWAYDEAQSLDSIVVPKAKEVFGEKLSNLLNKQPQYPGGIKRSEVMRRCYRTPGPILTSAHAIGMGLLRPEGMLTGITNKDDWNRIGYEVKGDFRRVGKPITIHRQPEYSPNPIPELWGKPVLEFETFSSREAEMTALAEKIMHNIVHDGLSPSRDILVLVLGSPYEAIELETNVASFLMEYDIDVYIPTALKLNDLTPQYPNNDPDKFWCDGGVTVSRITRAKGHEADMVYVVGFDHVARNESDVNFRNQLFVALTRARGWANLSGVGIYPMYDEMRKVITSGESFTFTYKRPPKRDIGDND
ncbi:ATP-binding domain-containing protein [Sphaerospermopsis aphanizomenoides BCCUSP55]|uniref:ATP-binding domain-containing protein n=1 Tax=Sphaerospermopsis aphanizomenoides TaxID=459663 RepID=UPI000AF19761|nr:nuclease-related domain-containing DEAD/DEAH box helicase [Sphaerospermopsis aphanizomenoides]MBK1987127.1 ATP-binding domain-containing protein [Sphaerospermopsis aphanizomenoides BCCUSP55]